MNNDYDLNNETFKQENPNPQYTPQQTYVTYIPYGLTPKTFEERKSIKKIALIIGGSLLVMLAISFIISLFLGVILSVLGFSGINIYSYLTDPAIQQVLQITLSTLMFTVPFIIFFKASGFHIRNLVSFKKPKKEDILPYFLFGISFCAFANIAVSMAGRIFETFGINYEVDFGENPQGFFGFMLTLLSTAIVPPLVEEFACRGLILGSLRKFGDGFAIMVSSIMFGIMHGNFQQMPFAFLVGLVLAYITVKSGSLWLAIAVHAFNNFISVFFDYALSNFSITAQNAFYAIFLSVCMLLGIFAVYLLKNRNKAYTLKASKTEATEAQKYKWFFGSATVIIFIIISVVDALTFFII